MLSQGRASCSSKRAPLPQHEVVCTADSATCHQQALSVRTQPQAQPSSAAAVGELEGRAAPDCGPHQAVDQLKGRLQQLQAERQVAEDLAEQMMLQAEALMAEKARVQALNCALQKERENLLERLEYMEQATVADHHLSPSASPEKEALRRAQVQAQEQLQRAQQEKEELLEMLESALRGLNVSGALGTAAHCGHVEQQGGVAEQVQGDGESCLPTAGVPKSGEEEGLHRG